MSARPGAPADQRTTIGRSRRTPAGTWIATPWFHAGAGELGEAVVGGERLAIGEEPTGAPPDRARSARPSVSTVTPASRAASSMAIAATRSSTRSRPGGDAIGHGRGAAAASAPGLGLGDTRRRRRGRPSEGRCTACRAGSSRSAARRTARAPRAGRPPASRAHRRPNRLDEGLVQRERADQLGRAAARAGRGRRVTRATPPSRASRAG